MTMRFPKPTRTRHKRARHDAEVLTGFFRPDELAAARAAEKRYREAEQRHYSEFRQIHATTTATTK